MKQAQSFGNLAVIAVLAAVYFAAGKLGLMMAFVHASATAVWLPTGIALATFLALGYQLWPGIFLGAFLVNVTTAGTVSTSIGIAVGNTLEGLAGAYLVNRFANGCKFLERAKDVFKFTFLAGLVSTAVSATFGVTSLCLGGYAAWANFGPIWWTWWLGDVGGALIMAPLLLVWSGNWRIRWNQEQVLEAGLLLLALVLFAQAVFGGWPPAKIKNYPLDFLCIPVLVWSAFRFGQRETVTATFLLSGMAIWGTLRGFGPFVRESQNESLLLLQTFMDVITVTAMVLAANVSERRRAEEEIQTSLKEKDVLLREVHHRVKNNLQVISSMLNLQARYIKDKKALEMCRECQNRVRSIALVHEKSYQSKGLSRLDFSDHVRSLVSHLFRSYGVRSDRIALSIHVEDVDLGIDAAIPCGLIINELVSNSLKHAFPQGKGEISVGLRQHGDRYILVVRDNGVGLPEGLDFPNTETLGLQIVNALTDQLGGSIELGSGAGTEFKVTFAAVNHEETRRHENGHRADISC